VCGSAEHNQVTRQQLQWFQRELRNAIRTNRSQSAFLRGPLYPIRDLVSRSIAEDREVLAQIAGAFQTSVMRRGSFEFAYGWSDSVKNRLEVDAAVAVQGG
jgi:CRISPR/Cas system-associated protein Cas10 (large subunit of type III CRISPR-Cas system)